MSRPQGAAPPSPPLAPARAHPPAPALARCLGLALFLAAVPAAAQERPREEDVFGAPPAEEKASTTTPATAPGARPGDADLFGKPEQATPDAEARVRERIGATEDPLKIGGLLYLRSTLAATESLPASSWVLAAPALLDVYLDARPNDRVRGFVLARTFYDPTIGQGYRPFQFRLEGLAFPFEVPKNPRGALDQLWLRFDLGRTAFLTVGKQHVKWGVGRFWNPGDFLHPVRRDPLAQFDDRTGVTMVRVHLPWEARGWNFYAVAAAERLVSLPGATATTPNALGALGGGGRAEIVLGGTEVGLSAVAQRGLDPRLAFDLTTGVWELDVRAEVAWKGSPDTPRLVPQGGSYAFDPSKYDRVVPGGRTDAVAGLEWSHKYSDEDTCAVGVEYFFHEAGYENAKIYPMLLLQGLYTPFFLGRHYAAAYFLLPQPGSWNLHTFTLSALANVTDGSGLVRLDWSYTLLTHLTLEAYAAQHLGKKGGEFRFGIPTTRGSIGTQAIVAELPAPVVDLGLALRLSL